MWNLKGFFVSAYEFWSTCGAQCKSSGQGLWYGIYNLGECFSRISYEIILIITDIDSETCKESNIKFSCNLSGQMKANFTRWKCKFKSQSAAIMVEID